jgi:CCR4-NOT transcriptional complex subunit CAF120
MGMGGQPGMQYPGMPGMMGSQGPNMNMMGMQMTGGSAFDPRLSPSAIDNNGGLQPPGPFQGQGQGPSSGNSSPVGRASPAARGIEHAGPRPSSGRSSPRPPPQ